MSEPEISGEIVPAPPAALTRYEYEDIDPATQDIRYEEPDAVARVFIRVEYADGRIREYQAQEPQDFTIRDGMTMRESPFRVSAGGLFTPLKSALATLSLSFTAHPRWNMHIRTEATAPEEFEGISYR